MTDSDQPRWRPNWRRAAVELVVIFVGVTSAFFVESYRPTPPTAAWDATVASGVASEVLPRIEAGPDAFYDASGRFDPAVRVRMALIEEFTADLARLSRMAGELADELEATLRD